MNPITHYGSNNVGSDALQGVIKRVLLKDVSTPSNSISHKLNSGPPVYDVGAEEAYGYEFWLGAVGVIVDAQNESVEFTGAQADYATISIRHKGSVNWVVQADDILVYSFDLDITGGSWVKLQIGGVNSATVSTNGTHTGTLSGFNGVSPALVQCGASGVIATITNISIKPYTSIISDGTVYEPSEEYGTLPDIMRPDEWLNTDANKVATGKTVTFNGLQGAYSGVNANNNDLYSGLHVLTFRVYDVTQGTVKVHMADSPAYSSVGTGVHTVYQNPSNSPIRVQDGGDSFIGSVEIISVKPVPKGLIYNNVTPPDWPPIITTPEYLFATFTATATTPADSLWRYDSTDSYAVAKVLDDEYTYTQNISDQPIPLVDGDEINWYVKDAGSMTTFYCYSNQLTGSIPNLSSNTALDNFNCRSNQLTGSIPDLSSNTALTYFRCYSNQLTGNIPDLSNNTALINFYCHLNQLTGSIPDLSSNTALDNFNCRSNQLTGSIPDLSSNTALTYFRCYSNQLTGFSGGWPNKAFNFDVSDNALTESAVNQILIDADTYGIPVGTTINLTGGTNSGPSGLGITAKNNLIANGATVTTNADLVGSQLITSDGDIFLTSVGENFIVSET